MPGDLGYSWAEPLKSADEALWYNVNYIRAQRLLLRMEVVEYLASILTIPPHVSAAAARAARFAVELNLVEVDFHRSRPRDLSRALRRSNRLLHSGLAHSPEEISQVLAMRDIVFSHAATEYELSGDRPGADRHIARAVRESQRFLEVRPNAGFGGHMRMRKLLATASNGRIFRLGREDVERAAELAERGDVGPLNYAVDIELSAPARSPNFDRLLEVVAGRARAGSAHRDIDLAKGATVARRWWQLQDAAGDLGNLDLFAAHVRSWRQQGLSYELKALALSLRQIASRRRSAVDPDVLAILDSQPVSKRKKGSKRG